MHAYLAATRPVIKARGLKKRALPATERAELAARVLTGQVALEPSIGLMCQVCNVSAPLVRDALKYIRTSLPPRPPTDAELDAVVAAAGTERTFNAVVRGL